MTGAELRAARLALGMSQRALAKELGVGQTVVWSWEAGKYPIERPATLALALEALSVRARSHDVAARQTGSARPARPASAARTASSETRKARLL